VDVSIRLLRGSTLATGLACLALTILATPQAGHGQAAYHDYAGLTAELQALAGASDAVTLQSIATTLGGREVWVAEIANRSGTPLGERPGVLVVGNLEGDHLVGSSHALETIRYLTSNTSDAVRSLLNDQVVYVIPRMNPDGAEAMFGAIRRDRRGNDTAYDDDNDGRTDEDGPDDLNGDGVITVMRVADPAGAFMIDPDDSRLMKRADASKGETGTHTVYWEGTDDDGDGFFNEDGPGGADLNRNFQHAYPYWQADAGVHMVSEAETRGFMDFIITHRNIGTILTFGHSDNLVTPPNSGGNLADPRPIDLMVFADASFDGMYDVGVFSRSGGSFGAAPQRGAQLGRDNDPGSGRRPSTTVHRDDQVYFTAVSDAYREITGIEAIGVNREAEGALFQWGYYQFGIPSFSTQGWSLPATEAEEGEGGRSGGDGAGRGIDAELLASLEGAGVDAFVDWSTYTHPDLGDVEIGGFMPYVTTNPAASELAGLGETHGEFVARLAGMLPRVVIADTEVTAHAGGIFTVEVEIANTGFLPTSLQHGVVSRAVQPTTIQIQIDPDDVVSGSPKTATIRQLAGSGSRHKVTWVIQGQSGAQVEIRVRSQKGGSDSATVTLR
jgi:hypothetical protein